MSPIVDLFQSVMVETNDLRKAVAAVFRAGQLAAPGRRGVSTAEADRIFLQACEAIGIEPAVILKPNRKAGVVELRRRVWELMRRCGLSYPEIAAATGMKHHTTVMHGLGARKGRGPAREAS